jgi:hypothetical protein
MIGVVGGVVGVGTVGLLFCVAKAVAVTVQVRIAVIALAIAVEVEVVDVNPLLQHLRVVEQRVAHLGDRLALFACAFAFVRVAFLPGQVVVG